MQEKRSPPEQCDKCLREMQIRAHDEMPEAGVGESNSDSESGSGSYASTDDLSGVGGDGEEAKMELEMLVKGLSLGKGKKDERGLKDEVGARSVRPLNLGNGKEAHKDELEVAVIARSVRPLNLGKGKDGTDNFSIKPLKLSKPDLQPEISPSPLKIDKPKPVAREPIGLGLTLGVGVGDPVKKPTIPLRSSSLVGLRDARASLGLSLGLRGRESKSEGGGAEETGSESEGYETDHEGGVMG